MTTIKPIPSMPGYLAGSDGSIIGKRGRPLHPSMGANGYLCFRISRPPQKLTVAVHVAVCEAFHGRKPDGHEVAHLNGNRVDNRSVNLAWKTRAANHADKARHGTHNHGERHYACKLTDQQVREIRASTTPAPDLARIYDTSAEYIRHIKTGRARKHVI